MSHHAARAEGDPVEIRSARLPVRPCTPRHAKPPHDTAVVWPVFFLQIANSRVQGAGALAWLQLAETYKNKAKQNNNNSAGDLPNVYLPLHQERFLFVSQNAFPTARCQYLVSGGGGQWWGGVLCRRFHHCPHHYCDVTAPDLLLKPQRPRALYTDGDGGDNNNY